MDNEFQNIQQETTRQFNQGLREKEFLTENEHVVEKRLLHIEIRRLTKELATSNEGYEHQLEVAFELQEQLTASETMLASLTEAKRVQQEQCAQLADELTKHQHTFEAVKTELAATQHQLATLRIEHEEHAKNLVSAEATLQQYQKASHNASPATPRSTDGTPHASGSNTQTGTSALYAMVEEILNPAESQQHSITELQQELRYIRREKDELQMTVERIFENPPNRSEDTLNNTLNPTDIPRACISPRTIIYHQLVRTFPPSQP